MKRIHAIALGGLVILLLGFVAFGASAVSGSFSSSAVDTASNGTINVSGTISVNFGKGVTTSGPPMLNASFDGPPRDPDGDGNYEDLNGNGRTDFDDIVVYFRHIGEPEVTDYVSAYDFNSNGRIDFEDIVTLFEEI